MPLCLISTDPMTFVEAYATDPTTINIPGLWYASGVTAGWESPDELYRCTSYTTFVPPPGKIITGPAIWSVDEFGVVTQTFDVIDQPMTSVVPNVFFRNLFTLTELTDTTAASLTTTSVRLMLDNAMSLGTIDLSDSTVISTFNDLVTLMALTAPRAAEILATQVPS